MGHTVELTWQPTVTDGVPRRFRRSGTYHAYVPDLLSTVEVHLDEGTCALVSEAEDAARTAAASVGYGTLGHVGDLLARSEASASSLIEGYHPTPRSVAVADFVQRGRDAAVTVARNLRAVRGALARSADPEVSLVRDALDLQPTVAREAPGIRTGAVWIGGATPLDAHFVAPPHDLVHPLLDDLDDYVGSGRHSPVAAAALAHAQFETIHPFGDGNGRVGRVLIGTILSRRGLTPGVALPVSAELFRDRERYYAALDAFRTDEGRSSVVRVLADAVFVAAEEATHLSRRVAEWEAEQRAALDARLRQHSPSGRARTGVAHRIIDALSDHPVLDATDAAEREGVSYNAARAALESLADAGVLRRDRKADRTRTIYVAAGLLELVAPSTQVAGADAGPVNSLDQVPVSGSDDGPSCGQWLPRAQRACALPAGHGGQHR